MVNQILMPFECEIDNLYYGTIEGEIATHYDMGSPDNSSLPIQLEDNDRGTDYILVCSRKSGEFSISNYKLPNGKYHLSVYPHGKLHKS